MSSLRQRFARLEQAIQPGARFFVLHPDPDPTLGLDEQIAAYAAENGVTARDIRLPPDPRQKLQAEGKMDKAKGEARQALGDVKDAAKHVRIER